MNRKSLYILLMIMIFSCKSNIKGEIIDYHKIQGLYKYFVIDQNNQRIIDSVYTSVIIKQDQNKDTLILSSNLMGLIYGTKNKFLGIWPVDQENNSKIKFSFYTRYFSDLKTGQKWDMEEDLGFSINLITRKFECINSDTTINIDTNIILNNITLVEQKDFMDVGGLWNVIQYGFDKDHKTVFYRKLLRDVKTNAIIRWNNYLVLDEFISKSKIDSSEYNHWIDNNSEDAIKWLKDSYDLNNIAPPPRHKTN